MPSEKWPLVLAGPMVRRVTPTSASIWIAVGDARRVRLHIFERDGTTEVAAAEADTVALGARLHVAVVTANTSLEWGREYGYALDFELLPSSATSAAGSLFDPGVVVATDDPGRARAETSLLLTYTGRRLPGFVLPPAELAEVRLVHGSCRMPHGQSVDALPVLDEILDGAIREGGTRPQQLFLHGDQIYADDIAAALLPRISSLAVELLGRDEALPELPEPVSSYGPGTRGRLLTEHAGFIRPVGSCHLVGLGEYCATYLLTWSEVLWSGPPDREHAALRSFYDRLPAVRRALANIATYMIFDDHEVTDDWNLTLEWSSRVLARPLGRQVITNALAAFAVFQAWGNDPDRFGGGAPGRRLLDCLAERDAVPPGLLGIPGPDDLATHDPPQLVPGAGALRWDFTVPGPGYDVLVIDQRTERAFPGEGHRDPPALLSDRAMDRQIAGRGPFRKPVTIVVSSCVLLDIPHPWYVVAYNWLRYRYKWLRKGRPPGYIDAYGPDCGDIWAGQTPPFERLLATLAGAAGESRVVWLCGDVHVGYAARLEYVDEDRGNTMVLAQLTASPLRREKRLTRTTARIGYGFGRRPPSLRFEAPGASYRCDYLRADDGTCVLGVNHLAEVRFEGDHVVQTMWWRTGQDQPALPHTRFRVCLDRET